MANPTRKMIEVYEMMKGGKPLNFDTLVSRLVCKPVTAMVLICALRRDCDAVIETIRNGRKVESYQLTNAADIASKMVGSSKVTKTKKTVKTVKTTKAAKVSVSKTKVSIRKAKADGVADAVSEYAVEEVSDDELADLKSQLGIA